MTFGTALVADSAEDDAIVDESAEAEEIEAWPAALMADAPATPATDAPAIAEAEEAEAET